MCKLQAAHEPGRLAWLGPCADADARKDEKPVGKRKRPMSHVIVVELGVVEGDDGGVQAVISLPGREGTLSRSYVGARGGQLSAPQLDDLRAWIDLTVSNWYYSTLGLQLSLEYPTNGVARQ